MARWTILLGLLVWYGTAGHIRSKDWVSDLSLWTRACQISPNSYRPHINRAKALYGVGRDVEAEQEVATALHIRATKGIM